MSENTTEVLATGFSPGTYRQSLVATFDSCALRALFSMQDQRRTPGSMAALGTLVHRAVHKAVHIMWDNGQKTFPIEMGMELLAEVLCQNDVPSEETVPLRMEDMVWARVLMIKWCESTRIDARKMIGAEERLYADLLLPTGETVRVTGQIDLLLADPPDASDSRPGIKIVDYKSGFRRPKDVRANTDEERAKAEAEGRGLTELGWVQNLIYSYLCFENFPRIQYTIFQERHILWDAERVAKTEKWKMERLRDVLAAQVARLHRGVQEGPESGVWTPSGGAHCALCPRPRDCPIKQMEGIPESYEEAQRAAQEWIVAGETRKRRNEYVKGWVDQFGPIEVPHADGRRVVGYELEGTRNLKLFEPKDVPVSPYDGPLIDAAREAGVLKV